MSFSGNGDGNVTTVSKQSEPPLKVNGTMDTLCFFWICWLTYFCTYLGRLNFSASMAEIITAEGFTKSQLGLVGSGLFFAYGLGQLVSGFLGDVLNPKYLVFGGITASSLMNLMMGFAASPGMMAVLWSLNGLAQAMVWSPMVRILSDRMTHAQCVKTCVNMATTTPAGTLCAFLLCSAVIALSHWRMVFYLTGGFMLAISLLWLVGMTRLEKRIQKNGVREPASVSAPSQLKAKTGGFVKAVLASGLLLISAAALLHGILKDGVVTWTPTYLTEMFQVDSAISIAVTTLIPVVNLAGVYLANFLNSKVFRGEISTSAFFFAVTVAALLALNIWGSHSMALSLVLLSITSSAMLAINTMVVNLAPLRYHRMGKVSTITGILNSLTYVGSAISIYGIGVLSDQFGWAATQYAWMAIALLGLAACLLVRRPWQRFCTASASLPNPNPTDSISSSEQL